MRSKNDARVAGGDTGATRPGFFRIHLDAVTQVHQLLRRLIRSGGSRGADLPPLESLDLDPTVDAYCLADASVDAGTRCAAVFQLRPTQRILFGGVYAVLSLETPAGVAYLELVKPTQGPPGIGGDALGIDSSLSTVLVRDGTMLRSAVLDDVTHLSTEQNYVRLHLSSNENVVMRGPLQKYESALPSSFVRLNRRLIINLALVERVKRMTRDLCVVSFTPGDQSVRLGRKASVLLRNAMMNRSVLPVTRASRNSAASQKEGARVGWPEARVRYERVAQVLAAAQRAHVTKLAVSPIKE